MRYNTVRYFMGRIMIILSAMMLVPMLVSMFYGEHNEIYYIIPALGLVFLGALCLIKKSSNIEVHIREGFLICSLSWIVMSLFGALPFYLSGYINSFTDAFFETVSGFTTTGSTILVNIEALPNSLLFWRSFTHWIGGMGVLVFVLAIFSNKNTKTMYIMRAEVPGPKVGKLVSKTKFTARILYGIYLLLTVLEIVLLVAGDMPLFDSITTAMSTAGTGGFSPKNASIAHYGSAYIEYVVTIFMILFGVNFTIFYFILIRNFKDVSKNEELRWYLAIILLATVLIWQNIYPLYGSLEEAFRKAFFQVSSIISTTGFITEDFGKWPMFSQMMLFILTFFGACAGSTGGGLKTMRIMILAKTVKREVKHMINPRSVVSVKVDSNVVDTEIAHGVSRYFIVYMFLIVVSVLIVSLDKLNIAETISSVVTCINNVGPGVGIVGPVGNFSELSMLSKWVLIFDMIAGRLELYPILVMLHPSFWR